MSDSIPKASIAVASPNLRDFSKKKRANRTAKLKQSKLDVRREQWLSQVKKTGDGCKEEAASGVSHEPERKPLDSKNKQAISVEKLEIKTSSKEVNYGNGSSMHHYSDTESLSSNSPSSHTSSVLGSNDSGVNFTTSSRSSSSSGRSSSSSSSHGLCSGHMSDDGGDNDNDNDAGEDDCLDDWEAVADALEAKDKKQQDCSTKAPNSEDAAEIDISNVNSKSGGTVNNGCAWHPDDAYRPQSLPNLSKQYTFPLNSERKLGRGSVWGCQNIGQAPTSCPICVEPLDFTDSSFLPCSCGYRLCLFCHKRILEEDGRCPGCRKKYECEPVEGETMLDGGSLTFRLTRACSMITRS